MQLKKIISVLTILLVIVLLATRCNQGENGGNKSTSGTITPVDLPVIVPGFNFPEDSNKIYSRMNNSSFPNKYDSASVYKHAWGVWAGLTSKTNQVYAGDSLLVYETWQGVSDVRASIEEINMNGLVKENLLKKGRTMLEKPRQFEHGFHGMNKKIRAAFFKASSNDTIDTNAQNNQWVTVSYSPAAASYAIKNKIFDTSVLNGYRVNNGIGSIPPFPNSSVTIKPTYYVGSETDSLIQIPVWPGAPVPAAGFPNNNWPRCVYADVHNRQQPNRAVVPALQSQTNPDSIKAATCNLSDFIYFKVDTAMAMHMNASDSSNGGNGPNFAQPGSIAILVGMHVATKEISNWTWQSFYWAPNPAQPFDPSSNLAASLRPSQLQGAASHYALVAAYAMVLPNQPINGGTNTGTTAVYGYNPYLEAGFTGLSPNTANNQFGVQSNCMSCHSLATPDGSLPYNTDIYISMNDPMFVNKVQLDFAWSIQGNLVNDSVKYKPR